MGHFSRLGNYSAKYYRIARRSRTRALITAGNDANARRAWPEAETAYSAALALDPTRHAIWVQYGHALKEQGFLPAAETAYRRALALNDGAADTHLQLGHVLKLQGRVDPAKTAYRNAYERDPASPHARAELAALSVDLPIDVSGADLNRRHLDSRVGEPSPRDKLEFTRDQRFIAAVTHQGSAYVSVAHLLDSHGLEADFLPLFDPAWYFHTNVTVRSVLRNSDLNACLVHFCQVGFAAVLAFNERYAFDAEFYRATYLDGMPFSAANAYRHWLNSGIRLGRAPNRQAWIISIFGQNLRGLDGLNIALHAATSKRDAAAQGWPAQFEHFVDGGAADPRIPLSIDDGNADALVAIADRMCINGKEPQSFLLYQRIVQEMPRHWHALRHYADGLRHRDCLLEAKRIYRTILEGQSDPSVWVFVNLSKCDEQMGALDEALASLKRGMDAFPGNVDLRRRFAELAQVFFTREWDVAAGAARTGQFAAAQSRLAAASRLVSSLLQAPTSLPFRPVRAIALVANQDLPQCRLYRVDQKLEQLRQADYAVGLYDFHSALPAFLADIYRYDAVIFYRVPALPAVIAAIAKARELGLVTFYEIDDLIFHADEYPSSLASYDGQIGAEEYVGLKLGVPLFAHALSLCDFALASTPPLAEQMARHVDGRTFVHRNALGRCHEAAIAQLPISRSGERVTVFYGSGTKAHKEDFQELIEPALVELVRRHGDRVAIVLMGYIIMTDRLRSIEDHLLLIEPNWDVNAYWAVLSQVDINIAVLKPSTMADCKSEIKWLEAAMFAVPSVVSDTATFRTVVEPGVTGFLCRTPADWTATLGRLVTEDGLRRQVGQQARERAIAAYGMPAMADNLRHMLSEVSPAPADAKPTILIVNVFYPPQAIGGATRVVHDNVRHLSQRYADRFHVEVFTSIEGGETPYQLTSYAQDGVRVIGVTTPQGADHTIDDDAMGVVFGRVLDHLAPALVHFHCIQRLTASIVSTTLAKHIPYMVSVHDGWWISDRQFLVDATGTPQTYDYGNPIATLHSCGQPAFDRLMRLRPSLRGAERVLAVSEPFAALHRDCGVDRVTTIANGMSVFPKPVRTASMDERVRLGFVGGMAAHKGYELIKYALYGHRFSHLRLLVIDHSLNAGERRQEVWGNTVVDFEPKRPQSQVGALYAEIDVLLAPSVWPESYGLVTREALYCGCWVVASDRGSIGEYVLEGHNGFIVAADGPDGLIMALQRIDGDPSRYLISPKERPVIRAADEQTDELAQLYGDILAGQSDTMDFAPRLRVTSS